MKERERDMDAGFVKKWMNAKGKWDTTQRVREKETRGGGGGVEK